MPHYWNGNFYIWSEYPPHWYTLGLSPEELQERKDKLDAERRAESELRIAQRQMYVQSMLSRWR